MPAWISRKTTKAAVFLVSLIPLVLLLDGFRRDTLGANPIEYITRTTGTWTLRFLLLTLAVTPARRILNQPALITHRRMLGLFAFFYGCLHLMTWIWLDKFFDPREMLDDVIKRRFITMGMFGFTLMIPLAITSTKGWIRRMGKNWARLHRLAYVTTLAGVIHYWWLVKSDIRLPLMYGVIAVGLLSLRLWKKKHPVAATRGISAPATPPVRTP